MDTQGNTEKPLLKIINKIGRNTCREYFKTLNGLGVKVRHLLLSSHDLEPTEKNWTEIGIKVRVPTHDWGNISTNRKQFIIAAVVSMEELENENCSLIDDDLHQMSTIPTFKPNSIVFRKGRIVIVLNDKRKYTHNHGEAILLDGDETPQHAVRNHVGSSSDSDEDYLSNMIKNYQERFNYFDKSGLVLLLYSYYIPCTAYQHHCADVVREYVYRSDSIRVIVAYDFVHRVTDEEEALKAMKTDRSWPILMEYVNTSNAMDLVASCENRDDDMVYLAETHRLKKRQEQQFRKTKKKKRQTTRTSKQKHSQ